MRTLWLAFLYRILMRPALAILGIRIANKAQLPKKGPFVVVSNHNSHLDTMALMASMPLRQIARCHPVAAAQYFGKNQFLARLSTLFVNTILIKRQDENPDQKALEVLDAYLRKGHCLLLFPEGSRGIPEQLQAFRSGVAVLLQQHPDIPFVPVYMKGMGKILPKGKKTLVPHEAFVQFGKAHYIHSNDISQILDEVKNAILALQDELVP
ncbi:MAG: hypothetical protein RLZZ301_858 [Bacteroidota bacterium]|jgi:1-acyl-sn-glycerol-3-phosphate acyltransferase